MWGGEKFSGKVVDATDTLGEGRFACYAMGNLAIMTGGVVPDGIPNPDPTAPYFLAMFPDGFAIEEGLTKQYVIMYSQGITPDPPVLSIVQTGGASADSGSGTSDFIVTGMLNTTTFSVSNVSKTYDEVHAAAEERKNIKLYLDVQGQGSYVVMPLTQMTPTVLAFGSIISEGARWIAQYTADGMTVKVG